MHCWLCSDFSRPLSIMYCAAWTALRNLHSLSLQYMRSFSNPGLIRNLRMPFRSSLLWLDLCCMFWQHSIMHRMHLSISLHKMYHGLLSRIRFIMLAMQHWMRELYLTFVMYAMFIFFRSRCFGQLCLSIRTLLWRDSDMFGLHYFTRLCLVLIADCMHIVRSGPLSTKWNDFMHSMYSELQSLRFYRMPGVSSGFRPVPWYNSIANHMPRLQTCIWYCLPFLWRFHVYSMCHWLFLVWIFKSVRALHHYSVQRWTVDRPIWGLWWWKLSQWRWLQFTMPDRDGLSMPGIRQAVDWIVDMHIYKINFNRFRKIIKRSLIQCGQSFPQSWTFNIYAMDRGNHKKSLKSNRNRQPNNWPNLINSPQQYHHFIQPKPINQLNRSRHRLWAK